MLSESQKQVSWSSCQTSAIHRTQSQEFDALVEAATDGDERRRFNYAEFRTLMTYPKCGIAKRILSGESGSIWGGVDNSVVQ